MPATKQDRQNLDELIRAHESYLQQVQLQRARLGAQAPPHLTTEIDRVEAELAQLKQAAAVKISHELVEELGPTGRYQLWMSHVMRLDMEIGRLRRMMELFIAQQERDNAALRERIDEMQYEVLRALGKRPRRRKSQEAV